jgi:hypothetical protein
VRMPVIISNEIVQYYGTMVKKPVIPSNEAAQYQGVCGEKACYH